MAIKARGLYQQLEIKWTSKGFSIWIEELIPCQGKVRHWIVDASTLFETNRISLGSKKNNYRYEAVFNKKDNTIELVDTKKKKKVKK